MMLKRNKSEEPAEQKKTKKKSKGVEIGKFEVVDNTAKFYVAKGLGKKRWVVVREISVPEIEHVEKTDNELSVTWKGATEYFFTKQNDSMFNPLIEQVNESLEEKQKTAESNDKTAMRRNEMLGIINASIGILDLSFDILIGLQEKRINWQQMETLSKGFGENMNLTGQTMPPLSMDFSEIRASVKTQLPKEASKEAFNILKNAYEYFDGLNPEADIKEAQPNFQTAKMLMQGYFMLNDLLLAKCVGEKDSSIETSELETILQGLAEANFKVNVEELKVSIERVSLEVDKQTLIKDARAVFKETLKQL